MATIIFESKYQGQEDEPVYMHGSTFGLLKGDLILQFDCEQKVGKIKEADRHPPSIWRILFTNELSMGEPFYPHSVFVIMCSIDDTCAGGLDRNQAADQSEAGSLEARQQDPTAQLFEL